EAVESARVTALGLEGDAHRNREHHGGPDRAVCLFAMEAIRGLQAEGHPVVPGGLGENVTLEGLDWSAGQPGARLRLGAGGLLEGARCTQPWFQVRPRCSD